ncbi:MAG: type IV-A pilus assembly ATPase PilB [Gammaproteobacteria bacterium]
MEDASSKSILNGYAYYLAEHQLLDKTAALAAFEQSRLSKKSYIEYLVKQKILDETQVARTTAEYFGLPLYDLEAFNLECVPRECLNIQLVKNKQALPLFKKNGMLYLAIVDPTIEYLYEIKFLTGFDVRLIIVQMSKLEHVVDEQLNSLILAEMDDVGDESVSSVVVNTYKDNQDDPGDMSAYDTESAPVVNYVNRILLDAIEKKASDIHFEHYEDSYRIRFRQHGILSPINSPPPIKMANYLLARIKVMSDLDITEHRVPQDGRFKLILSRKKAVDFRVSTCPTLFGEKIVLRILDTAQTLHGIEQLGMDDVQKAQFEKSLQYSQGMILVTGPTGSGKTVSLYSALHYLNSPEKNISTVEDPVEIPVAGINQVNINLKTGLTFSTALRSFLRQDPDIIMVGEVRDLETAEIAIKAAQTGHLVLSTLHTNSAPETVTRLMNMGIAPYNLAGSLKIVIAQRLVRVLCHLCKQKEIVSHELLLQEGFLKEELDTFDLYAPKGCDHCVHGFKGRVGIFEVMPISSTMTELILRGENALQLMAQAKSEGMSSLRESGLKKVKEGITSIAELNRVFK